MSIYLIALCIGALIGLILRSDKNIKERKSLSDKFAFFALTVLLPVHLATAGLRAASLGVDDIFKFNLIWGMLTCFFTILILHFLVMFTKSGKQYLKYQGSTFAGGGRALILVSIIAPFIANYIHIKDINNDEMPSFLIDTFVMFDLGYWFFYCLIIYKYVMPKSYKKQKISDNKSFLKTREYIQISSVLIGFIAVYIPINWLNSIPLITYLPEIRTGLSALIVSISAVYLTLSAELKFSGSVFSDFGMIMLGRLISFSVILLLINTIYGELPSQITLPLLVLFIAPPSSFIPMMLQNVGAPEKNRKMAVNLGTTWTLVFLGLILVLSLVLPFVS